MSRDRIGIILMDRRLRTEVGVRLPNPSSLPTDTVFVANKKSVLREMIYSLDYYLREP